MIELAINISTIHTVQTMFGLKQWKKINVNILAYFSYVGFKTDYSNFFQLALSELYQVCLPS